MDMNAGNDRLPQLYKRLAHDPSIKPCLHAGVSMTMGNGAIVMTDNADWRIDIKFESPKKAIPLRAKVSYAPTHYRSSHLFDSMGDLADWVARQCMLRNQLPPDSRKEGTENGVSRPITGHGATDSNGAHRQPRHPVAHAVGFRLRMP